MIRITALVIFLGITSFANSQEKGDVHLATEMDLIKSDYDIFFNRVQIGLEANYFFNKKASGTLGMEIWTQAGLSAVIGGRWYPTPEAFLRARALFGTNDFSLGAGFSKPLSEVIRFEAMTDVYFEGTFTIRAGVAYIIRKE